MNVFISNGYACRLRLFFLRCCAIASEKSIEKEYFIGEFYNMFPVDQFMCVHVGRFH